MTVFRCQHGLHYKIFDKFLEINKNILCQLSYPTWRYLYFCCQGSMWDILPLVQMLEKSELISIWRFSYFHVFCCCFYNLSFFWIFHTSYLICISPMSLTSDLYLQWGFLFLTTYIKKKMRPIGLKNVHFVLQIWTWTCNAQKINNVLIQACRYLNQEFWIIEKLVICKHSETIINCLINFSRQKQYATLYNMIKWGIWRYFGLFPRY